MQDSHEGKAHDPPFERPSDRDVFELVCRSMRRIVGRRHPEFEDLVQQAAERAIRDLPSFKGESSLSTWVFRVSYRTMLQESRWRKRWLKRFTMTRDGVLPDAPTSVAPDGLYDFRERNRRVREAVERLTPKLAAVVTLVDLEGMSATEVSELLEIPLLTVRSRLRAARKGLTARLAKDPYFGSDAEGEMR